MGNTISVKTQNYFYSACMAKYTGITKPQVMAIRNLLVLLSSQTQQQPSSLHDNRDHTVMNSPQSSSATTMMVSRKHLHKAMRKVNVVTEQDFEVIDLIYTMWLCENNENKSQHNEDTAEILGDNENYKTKNTTKALVPWYELLISLSLLACKTDTFEQTIRFTLYVVHRNHFFTPSSDNTTTAAKTSSIVPAIGYVSSSDARSFVRAICTTTIFYGDLDTALSSQQIQDLVDTIFDAMITKKNPNVSTDHKKDEIGNQVVRPNNSMLEISAQQNDDNDMMSFDEFVKGLLQQPVVQGIVLTPVTPPRRISMKIKKKKKSRKGKKKSHISTLNEDDDDMEELDSEMVPTKTTNVRKVAGMKISNIIQNAVTPCGGGTGTGSDDDIVVIRNHIAKAAGTNVPSSSNLRKIINPRNGSTLNTINHSNNHSNGNINGNHNTSKYMPLIDEIERDAKKKLGFKYNNNYGSKQRFVSSKRSDHDDEPGSPIALKLSSSCSITDDDNDDDNINNINKNEIQLTTTEEEDDTEAEDEGEIEETGIEVGCDDINYNDNKTDDDQNSLKDSNHYKKDKKSIKNHLPIKTSNQNTKIHVRFGSNMIMKKSLQHLNNKNTTNNNKMTMSSSLSYYTTSQYSNSSTNDNGTTSSPLSVASTDLSSHMSSAKLIPVTRIGISN